MGMPKKNQATFAVTKESGRSRSAVLSSGSTHKADSAACTSQANSKCDEAEDKGTSADATHANHDTVTASLDSGPSCNLIEAADATGRRASSMESAHSHLADVAS